jgi:hypothetical protein
MSTHADKAEENKHQLFAAGFTQKQGGGASAMQLLDNRPEAIAQRRLQEMANRSPQVAQLRAFQEMADNSPQTRQAAQLQQMANGNEPRQTQTIQKKDNTSNVVQMQPKEIPEPNKEQVLELDMLNQRNRALTVKYEMESKGTHGTNWMHAISIMKGIKAQVPKEMQTSDVTPEDGGFFVDISKTGEGQSHDFAKMAAYGTPKTEGTDSLEDVMKYSKQNEKHQADFNDNVNKGKGTRRAIILEIWGQKNATPEARKKGQQEDEDIYKKNAHLLVATLKDSL